MLDNESVNNQNILKRNLKSRRNLSNQMTQWKINTNCNEFKSMKSLLYQKTDQFTNSFNHIFMGCLYMQCKWKAI